LYYAGNMTYKDHSEKCTKYARFLKKTLTLGMFIPCNEDGKPLEEPKSSLIYKMQVGECSADEMRQNREYNEAKERVLFEGINAIKATRNGGYHVVRVNDHTIWLSWNKSKNIEDLLKHDIDLTLTP